MTLRDWPLWMKILWQVVALFVFAMQGPRYEYGPPEDRAAGGFVFYLRPDIDQHIGDFFQEWASARNWQAGLPIYMHQIEALNRHLGVETSGKSLYVEYNAHPPGAVLLTLPFGYLEYLDALLLWNLLTLVAFAVSVALILSELKLSLSPWLWLPLCAALLLFDPFLQQMFQGQLNGLLLLLLTLAWLANRRGWEGWAGVAVGIATAVKLVPGLLLVYFLTQRRWTALVSGVAAFLSITVATFPFFGVSAYQDFVLVVQPAVAHFRSGWINYSLAGFWEKLFLGSTFHPGMIHRVEPLVFAPLVGRAGLALSCLTVLGVLYYRGRARPASAEEQDRLFGLYMVAMLLLSPVSWNHTFLLLVLPVLILVKQGVSLWGQAFLLVGVALLYPNYHQIFWELYGKGATSGPVMSLALFALPTYVLVGLFVLMAQPPASQTVPQREDALLEPSPECVC